MRRAKASNKRDDIQAHVPVIEEYRNWGRDGLTEYGLGEEFTKTLAHKFMNGVVGAFFKPIRMRLTELGLQNVEIATAMGVDESTVSKWLSTGSISFWNLARVAGAFQIDLNLIPFPSPKHAVVQGYIAGIQYARKAIVSDGKVTDGPSEEEVRCLMAWSSNAIWMRAAIETDPIRKARYFEQAAQAIRISIRSTVPDSTMQGVDAIQGILKKWKDAWLITITSLPYNWPT